MLFFYIGVIILSVGVIWICVSPFFSWKDRSVDKNTIGIRRFLIFLLPSLFIGICVPLYGYLGSPGFRDQPFHASQKESPAQSFLDEGVVASFDGLDAQERALRIQGMVQSLSDRLSDQGGDAVEWARLGHAYRVLNDFVNAEKAFSQAAERDPENPEWYVLQAQAAWQTNNLISVVAALKQALGLNATHSQALWLTGQLALRYGDTEQAEFYFRAALKNIPKNTEMRRLLESDMRKMLQQSELSR